MVPTVPWACECGPGVCKAVLTWGFLHCCCIHSGWAAITSEPLHSCGPALAKPTQPRCGTSGEIISPSHPIPSPQLVHFCSCIVLHCMTTLLHSFMQSIIDELLGGFQLGSIADNTAVVSLHVCVGIHTCVALQCMPRSGLSQTPGMCMFNYSKHSWTLSHGANFHPL